MPAGSIILYRCNVTWLLYGQNCINSFFLKTKETSTKTTIQEEMNDIHDDVRNRIITPFRDVIADNCQLLSSVMFNLNGNPNLIDVRDYVGVTGNVSSPALPSMISQVISWRTQFRSRRDHGRTYLPGLPINSLDGNFLHSAAQSALDNAASTVLQWFGSSGNSSDAYLVVYSRKNGNGVEPTVPPTVTYNPEAGLPVSRYVADNIIYTQRHRLQGKGI